MRKTLLAICLLLPLALGEEAKKAPDFTLKNPKGEDVTLSKIESDWIVLEWNNHECPFVMKHYKCENMQNLQKKWTEKKVTWLTICSSGPGKQGYRTDSEWLETIKDKKMRSTQVLIDADGKIGRAYKIKRTPTMVILNKKKEIVYWGGLDSERRAFSAEEIKAATNYVDVFLTAVTAGKPAPFASKPAYG